MARIVAGRTYLGSRRALGTQRKSAAISEITTKVHSGAVMRKMKARPLPDLVTMADRLGVRQSLNH